MTLQSNTPMTTILDKRLQGFLHVPKVLAEGGRQLVNAHRPGTGKQQALEPRGEGQRAMAGGALRRRRAIIRLCVQQRGTTGWQSQRCSLTGADRGRLFWPVC